MKKKIIKGQLGPPGGLQTSGGAVLPNFNTTLSAIQTGQFLAPKLLVPQLPSMSFNSGYLSNLDKLYNALGMQTPSAITNQMSPQETTKSYKYPAGKIPEGEGTPESKKRSWGDKFQGVGNMSSELQAAISGAINSGIDSLIAAKSKGVEISEGEQAAFLGLNLAEKATQGTLAGVIIGAANKTLQLANSTFTSKTDKFGVDEDTVAKMGADYGGGVGTILDAANNANKEISLIGTLTGRTKKANKKIKEGQVVMAGMNREKEEAADALALQEDPNAQIRRDVQLIGGVDILRLSAKQGGILKPFTYKEAPKEFEAGGTLTKLFVYKEAPNIFQEGGKTKEQEKHNIRTLEELIEFAKKENPRFVERMSEPVKDIDLGNGERGTHRLSWEYIGKDKKNAIVYPEVYEDINGELIYNPEQAYDRALRNKDYLLMAPEEAELFSADNYKQGWPEFFLKFAKGGSFNIIPEGALHARKHNMDETGLNITHKGIPVVSTDNNELQAEIEHSEIIFRIEVTEKIEELLKEYEKTNDDTYAIQVGDMLVKEILYNTDDRTNLISLV